jgi:lipopolysaccharide transport system ATP-binding protein
MSSVIKVENLSKQYRLGEIGTGSISHDINRWWHTVRGKEDPYLKIGETNDRSKKGESEYVWSLKDINFEIEQGDAVGIIGRNGAGKSTLLKILSRVTGPTTGSLKVKGRIASLLEVGTGFHPELSGRENIFLNGAILGMRKHEIQRKFDEIVDFSGVERYIDTPVKRYSSGMYVRLAFAVAAHLESEILIVDEVLAVGDAEFQRKCLGKMNDVSNKEGRTILFVSHNMAAIKNLCKTGIILKNGLIDFKGDTNTCVDKYASLVNESASMEKHVTITNSHRKYMESHNRIIDFVSVELLNPDPNSNIATDEPISIKFILKGKKEVSNFRIAGGINTMEEQSVGVVFGEQNLCIKENETIEVLLSINNHQLAKGKYYMDFSIGIGDHTEGITDFDHISQTIFFEVAYTKLATKEMIPIWPSNWGNINFQEVTINQLQKI